MDAHELVAKLKEMAISLGRVPTRDEFQRELRSRKAVTDAFGSFSTLVQAAGLSPGKPRKIDNSIFEKDIVRHLDEYKPRSIVQSIHLDPWPSAAICSDIHWPFANARVIDRFIEFVGDAKPEFVIINGDAWDMYAHTKFPRTHNLFKPREEEALARQMNEEFWQRAQKASPRSKCHQLLGNHDVRPLKRVLEAYPEAEDWIKEKVNSLFTFNGVATMFDPREELFLSNNVIVFHGYKTKLGDHRDYTMYCTANGHSHVGGVVFRKVRGSVLWELNSGLSGDPEAKGLTYTAQKITNWTPGFAVIDGLGPRFIPV